MTNTSDKAKTNKKWTSTDKNRDNYDSVFQKEKKCDVPKENHSCLCSCEKCEYNCAGKDND